MESGRCNMKNCFHFFFFLNKAHLWTGGAELRGRYHFLSLSLGYRIPRFYPTGWFLDALPAPPVRAAGTETSAPRVSPHV